LGSLNGFNFFESHSFSFAFTASGVLFGFFEEHNSFEGGTVGVTFTAFDLGSASGVFANKLTFGFGAFGFVAFPVTFGFFTDGFTFGFGDLAMGDTVRRFTDGDTFGAVFHFACFFGAHDLTVGSFTFDVADGIFGFLA
jgi:hypothetical protein